MLHLEAVYAAEDGEERHSRCGLLLTATMGTFTSSKSTLARRAAVRSSWVRVVKDLTQHLKGKNHQVFLDNFFASEELLHDLAEDIFVCGTA